MYLGHSSPVPHPSSTLSYDTQPVISSAFQHRAGRLAELVQPLRNVFVQVCCTLPFPLLGIIMNWLKVFQEKQSFEQDVSLSAVETDTIITRTKSVRGSEQHT